MYIDVHAHIVVPEILRSAARPAEWRPRVWWQDGIQLVEFGGRVVRSVVEEVVDIERILGRMAERGVDHMLLSPWVPLLYLDVETSAALERCRIQNEALAALGRADEGRLSVLGAVPLQDPELAATELTALIAAGSACGVEVAATVGGDFLGADRFEPFWAAAESCEALVFIHPTASGLGHKVFRSGYLWNSIGNPLETTITLAHLIVSGVLERHPRLRILAAHGGGALPALIGRMTKAHDVQPDARARVREKPEQCLRRIWFDSVTHDVPTLRALVDAVGADHVVLGSDYPFEMADAMPAATVRACGFPPAAEEAILAGNARALVAGSGAAARGRGLAGTSDAADPRRDRVTHGARRARQGRD